MKYSLHTLLGIVLLPTLLLGGCAPQTPQGTGSGRSSSAISSIGAISSSQKGLSGKPLQGTANVPAQDLQQNVNQKQIEETEKRQAELLQEAISAVAETRNAVDALDKKDTKGALAAMERATGKLDIVLTRDPRLALAPLDSTQQVIELQADPAAIEAIRAQAKAFMANDDIQRARQLLSTLESEIQVSTLNIPLKTYPAAIRQAVTLLDQGKLEESKVVLEIALNTLVITQHSIPIPLLNAQYELDQATKEIPRNRNRAKALLEDARLQIVLAEKLGYGKLFSDDYQKLYQQIRDANATLLANQGSGGLLDALQSGLEKLRQRISL